MAVLGVTPVEQRAFADGTRFGETGPYQMLRCRVRVALDPRSGVNRPKLWILTVPKCRSPGMSRPNLTSLSSARWNAGATVACSVWCRIVARRVGYPSLSMSRLDSAPNQAYTPAMDGSFKADGPSAGSVGNGTSHGLKGAWVAPSLRSSTEKAGRSRALSGSIFSPCW